MKIAEGKIRNLALREFTKEMKSRMEEKSDEGKSGWDNPDWCDDDMQSALLEAFTKCNMIDVANYAMFIWNRQEANKEIQSTPKLPTI